MSWKTVKLGAVIKQRKAFITINDSEEYKRYRVQVNRKGVVLRDVVKGSAINTKKQQVCKEGDFLVAEIDAKVGGYGFVGKELEGAIVSSHYFLFEVNEELMLKEYLTWSIKTDIIQHQISSKGSTNYAAIRPAHVLAFEIPIPENIDDQKAIVDRLNTIYAEYNALNTELTNQQTYLQLLRQTILQEAVQGKLTHCEPTDEPASALLARIKAEKAQLVKRGKLKKEKELPLITKAEMPFALPEGWVWCRLGEIATLITKGSSPKWQGVEYVEKGVLFVTSENVDSFELDLSKKKYVEYKFNEIEPRSILRKGDFLMNIVGASIGRTAVYDLDENANINQAVCLIRIESSLIHSEFLLDFFNSPLCVSYMFDKQVDNARANLSMGNISNFLIPLPPCKEQKQIITKLQYFKKQINNLEQTIDASNHKSQLLLQTILKEAFQPQKEVYRINETLSFAAEA